MMPLIETKWTEMRIRALDVLKQCWINIIFHFFFLVLVLYISGWSKTQLDMYLRTTELLILVPWSSDCWDYKHVPLRLVYVVFMTEPGASYMLSKHSANGAKSSTLACFSKQLDELLQGWFVSSNRGPQDESFFPFPAFLLPLKGSPGTHSWNPQRCGKGEHGISDIQPNPLFEASLVLFLQ